MSVFCEHLKLELSTEEPAMNDPFAHAHSKKDSEHPAAELNEREGASWPSEKESMKTGTVLKTLINLRKVYMQEWVKARESFFILKVNTSQLTFRSR